VHAQFIVTVTTIGPVIDSVKSRFGFVFIPEFSKDDVKRIFARYCECNEISSEYSKTPEMCDYNMTHCLLLLSLSPVNEKVVDPISHVLTTMLHKIKRTHVITNIIVLIRDNIYLLMKYDVSHNTICRKLMMTIIDKHAKNQQILHSMTRVIANTEYMLINSSKPIYHYEKMFLEYKRMLAT